MDNDNLDGWKDQGLLDEVDAKLDISDYARKYEPKYHQHIAKRKR